MKIYNSIIFLAIVALCYLFSILGTGCAQIGMPTGGPKDTIPPVLLNSNPAARTLHFTGNRVTFTFDEYVHLQDLQNSLLVNPVPKIIPNVTSKLKTVSIKIRDTLQPNTTYSFEFGNAIQSDENNGFRNFTYVFSTGSYIDSMRLNGKVLLAETGKPDSTLLVLLYSDFSDSAVYKKKPKYVARLDSLGNYQFNLLAEGTYHLFSLKDESGQKMYNNPSQLFAFADSAIHISQNVKPVDLYAYSEEKFIKPGSSPAVSNKKNPDKLLKFSNSLTAGAQDLLSPLTLQFETPLKNFDSSKIKLTDTLYHPIAGVTISLDTTQKIITVASNWVEDTKYKLVFDKDFGVDTLNDELKKSDTITFKTKQEREYGSLKLDFSNLQKIKHPVLQFVQNNKIVDSFKITSPTFYIKLFNPGDYELRILDDENGNGTWDPGNYHFMKQPERVIAIPQKLTIRSDWDNETEVQL